MGGTAPRRRTDVIGTGYNKSLGIYNGRDYYRESLFHNLSRYQGGGFIYYHTAHGARPPGTSIWT